MIDPFELHPDTPKLKRPLYAERITIGQLNDIVDNLTINMHAGPGKTWGHSRSDVEYWMRMVIHEAEKVITTPSV